MTGIRTIEDVRDRCYVDESDCWHWRGATTLGSPVMWVPAVGKVMTLGSTLTFFVTGARNAGIRWRAKCGNRLCCNPSHRTRMTHSALMASAGIKRTAAQAQRNRMIPRRYSDEMVAAIRAEIGTLAVVAEKFGVGKSYVSRLRRQELRPEQQRAVNGSNVFVWRAAA